MLSNLSRKTKKKISKLLLLYFKKLNLADLKAQLLIIKSKIKYFKKFFIIKNKMYLIS